MSATPNINSEYDIIVAGGGTSGCLLASRLASADSSLRILVLEAGPPTKDLLTHIQPARYLSHLAPTSTTVRFHAAQASENLGGRKIVVPCGQCLGGGSSVNFAMYTRASRSDYDDWEETYENQGWGSKDLIPLLKKTETYQEGDDALNHGSGGPLKVSYGGKFTNVGQQYLDVASKFDKERGPNAAEGENVDPNDLVTVNKYGRWQKWIDTYSGKRSDVPHHFIYNPESEQNENLHVVTGVLVRRVLIEGDRATGVEFSFNPRFFPDVPPASHTVSAKQMVVVSAGTFGSPGILERSGVGRRDVLEKCGVDVRVELEGVGEGYQDHNVVFVPYLAAPDADTLDAIVRNDTDEISLASGQWFKDGKGLMAHNGIDGGVKMRPSPSELEAFGPEFKRRWDTEFVDKPDKPVLWMGIVSMLVGDPSTVAPRKYFSLGFYNEYPAARGHIHITDCEDVQAPTDFRTGFLDDMADVRPLVWGYKFTREIARRMPVFRGELAEMHPKFPNGSKAALIHETDKGSGPLDLNAPMAEYGPEDDAAIEKYTREFVSTAWHSLGTCSMKPRAKGGVVDSRLNVYGVQGLKVCDMSICPGNVGANTYSTALVVGEKGATIIAQELGIQV
ncbi:alcohol oxidase-like protein [Stereum hirsutum FP-91666 SS1]|uniref:alcohol oxidase-like protein n=1 Tax=Stereum hirsutum (strain FP-91666) TaxID=721885 RepID=UPI000440C1D2|nr:alcohol oxidase-like protein [Stereum hirsutum FP-91666 SS1]EIM87866.1 alcohol oxidase-like protein [Stereum hirsutum FP-91666 SS1]